jgi:DNA-directed RNA polymerase alpha subunit
MNIYNMKLNEVKSEDKNIHVVKVAGGWIYWFFAFAESESSISMTSSFVPYDSEFESLINKENSRNIKLSELNLSVRINHVLQAENILTISDAIKYKISDYKNMRNLGTRSINQLKHKLLKFGYKLEL